MDTTNIAKQMIAFQKATFNNTFNAMVLLQEQTEATLNSALKQFDWLPEEGQKAIGDWIGAYKKGREEFKKVGESYFVKVDSFFSGKAGGQK